MNNANNIKLVNNWDALTEAERADLHRATQLASVVKSAYIAESCKERIVRIGTHPVSRSYLYAWVHDDSSPSGKIRLERFSYANTPECIDIATKLGIGPRG